MKSCTPCRGAHFPSTRLTRCPNDSLFTRQHLFHSTFFIKIKLHSTILNSTCRGQVNRFSTSLLSSGNDMKNRVVYPWGKSATSYLLVRFTQTRPPFTLHRYHFGSATEMHWVSLPFTLFLLFLLIRSIFLPTIN